MTAEQTEPQPKTRKRFEETALAKNMRRVHRPLLALRREFQKKQAEEPDEIWTACIDLVTQAIEAERVEARKKYDARQ